MNLVLYYFLLTVHVLACIFLICVVLLQQGKGQDLASAFGGGGSQTAFGPRGSANVLSRLTTVLGAVFMITSMSLSVIRPRSSSVLDQMATPAKAAAVPSPAAAPAASPAAAPVPPASSPAAPPAH